MMKKILLLGGSAQQVKAIETAKKNGYYTVLCDYLPDNPGRFSADKHYLISTTDREAVLDIARKEQINGILAYASDPAAPAAAYVAEKLGLPGNPYESVETLCNKERFRAFLKNHGFNAPIARGYETKENAMGDLQTFRLPIIVKPVDSSGSKGATVLRTLEVAEQAVEFAFSFSRSHHIIIEEFIKRKHPYLIGGDVFILDGQIVLWGLMNCHRDSHVNPLVPVGKSYPLKLDSIALERVKETLQALVDHLRLQNGALNVEIIVDENNEVWPIDVGPRCGGNMIPELLGYIFHTDVVEMSIKVAMGEFVDKIIPDGTPYYATYNLHTDQNGFYKSLTISPEIQQYIIKTCIYKKEDDRVEYFDNAAKALGILFLKFDSEERMDKILLNINDFVQVNVEN